MTSEDQLQVAAKRELLRHGLATLAYRGGKVLRDAPPGFATFHLADGSRSPAHILAHIGDLLEWSLSIMLGKPVYRDSAAGIWDQDVARFYAALAQLDEFLASGAELGTFPERLLQGPIADALTHVGQLAMLRRLAGSPISEESYFKADIVIGRVGPDQSFPWRKPK